MPTFQLLTKSQKCLQAARLHCKSQSSFMLVAQLPIALYHRAHSFHSFPPGNFMNIKTAALCLLFFLFPPAFGVELPLGAQKEITQLLSLAENSGCEFNRNGSWHKATEAAAHLRHKYQYLVRWNLIASTEDFILGAATESSITHQPYLVRCPGQPVIDSAHWFNRALRQHRQSTPLLSPG